MVRNILKSLAITLVMVFSTQFALAQQSLNMTSGTYEVPSIGYRFYDSGGPLLFNPATDPTNANEYNWTTWYQHNENYVLKLTAPEGKGIKVTFTKCRINNDYLYFYEGTELDEANLISILTCNDYSSSMDNFSVVSHSSMTIRFESDYHWRDEGWEATITLTDAFTPQAPVAVMAACANQMVLIPTCNADAGGTMPMQYKLNGNAWQDYTTTGEWVDLASQTFPLTVRTRTKIDDTNYSDENTFVFNKILPPGVAGGPVGLFSTVHEEDLNQLTVYFPEKPVGVNDTYYVRWTINNNSNDQTNDPTHYTGDENPLLWNTVDHEFREPSSNNSVPGGVIDYTDVNLPLPFYIHLAMRGTTCPDLFSGVVTLKVTERYVPMPTISFETSGTSGLTTLACSLSGTTIYYTTDGSNPTTGSAQYTGSNFPVQPGTTVNAIAVRDGYTTSPVASAIFIPGGENGGSGVYDQVVLLDDREPHSWSYYSDKDQPIHSLNPTDVKITYFGNGTGTVSTTDGVNPANNSWTADATGVQVGPNETGNQFVYLKTLENDDPEGEDNKYSYNTIPNPFSKRPTYSNVVATRNISVRGTIQDYANGYINVTYTDVNNVQRTWSGRIYYDGNHSVYPEANLQVLAGTTLSFSLYTDWAQGNGRISCEIRYDNAGGTMIWNPSAYGNNDQNNPVTGSTTVQEGGSNGGSVTFNDYRGFYAWRVKRVSSGLEIKRANGNTVNVGDMVLAEEALQFVTSKEDGNEVDFEALWAKAYVFASINALNNAGNGNYVPDAAGQHRAYERNFVVVTGDFGNTANNRPATISCLNPDGSGTVVTRTGVFTLNADTKFEYINLNNAGGTFSANNHYLCFGRGISTNNTAAARVQGIPDPNNEQTFTNAFDYTIRMESGKYSQLSFVHCVGINNNDGTAWNDTWNRYYINNTIHVNAIMGSDYDRAKNDNDKLDVSANRPLLFSQQGELGAVNQGHRIFDCVIKSGNYQKNYQTANVPGNNLQSFYCGPNSGSSTTSGSRYVTVEGGKFAIINGGTGGDDTDLDRIVFTLRMKGGSVERSVYGAGANSENYASRKIIVTGGTVKGWIAGGANGTDTNTWNTSIGSGNSFIYVGGNAIVGGSTPATLNGTEGGNIFGAGRGNSQQAASMLNSTVVVADNANILHNVYGGGNYGYIPGESKVYVLGGTVQENVFGGAYGNVSGNNGGTFYDFDIPTSNVYVKGGTVVGNVYGGSNWGGKVTNANVTMTGGTVTNVYGGGFGPGTNIGDSRTSGTIAAGNTTVTVSGGTVINNIYGGGEEGTVGTTNVVGNTNVTYSGGSVQNVFGAGKGVVGGSTALISGQTNVIVKGGTVNESVYGGGEAGDVNNGTNLASTVNITGGTVKEDVFGGGKLGKTTGNVIVNVYEGNINGNVFGGAFGQRGGVYIAGTHTVNIMGGNIYTNVYGGSRNANDALSINDPESTDPNAMINCVNISGGHVYYQVFAGGFFGQNYGSVYAFIGQNAIFNAPHHAPTTGLSYNVTTLIIDGSVWAGADFGSFDGNEFGAETIEGYSNVYIDGLGYNTVSAMPSDAGYMNIGTSVLGVGTSCYAGKLNSDLIFRNYGQTISNPAYGGKDDYIEPYTSATRNLMSIQFFDNAVVDRVHVHYIGQGRINSLLTTEKYAIYDIKNVLRITNGGSLFIDYPIDQIKKMGSYTCPDVYAGSPTYTKLDYGDLNPAPAQGKDNKIRVNAGAYVNVKYLNGFGTGKHYGELEGFFYMMTDGNNSVCAYARPKQSKDDGNQINPSYDNPLDGGFVSYINGNNTYTAGTLTGGVFASPNDAPGDGTPGVQMPYENHTLTGSAKAGEEYFRIWRYGGMYSYRQGVFNAVAKTEEGYSTTDVVISLPASRGDGSFFRIKTIGGFPNINFGDDVLTVNAGCYGSTTEEEWMYYVPKAGDTPGYFVTGLPSTDTEVTRGLDLLENNVNANFGLVAIPQGSLVGGTNGDWLICNAASDENELLTTTQWTNIDQTINPSILFRLTYNNQLTNNVVWDPITIIFEQCVMDGGNVVVKDEIEVALSVSTNTTIEQNFTAQTFALMDGSGTVAYNTFTAKVVLPSYFTFIQNPGDLSQWKFESATWIPNDTVASGSHIEFNANSWKAGSGYTSRPYEEFSMEIRPSYNFDNTLGWTSYDHTAHDLYTLQHTTGGAGTVLSATDGRNNAAFDFILHYDRRVNCNDEKLMGVLRVTMLIDNYKSTTNTKEVVIDVEVWRRGIGINYYLDGVNGDNFRDGQNPNTAKKTLSGIFNHSKYKPGDNIFIVNTVTADASTALDWNGQQYSQVIIYRYPGGHPLAEFVNPTTVDCYLDYSTVYNPDNIGFAGPLVNVETSMNMHGIVLDGFQNIRTTTTPGGSNILYYDADKYVTPTAPLVEIAENATLTIYAESEMRWNYSNCNGGAVHNAGTLIMNEGSDIVHNAVVNGSYNGAGVYLTGGAILIVSDSVNIVNNHVVTHAGVATNADHYNNVYLETPSSVIQVGTLDPNDRLEGLDTITRIGVTKGEWGQYYYTPIAYSNAGYLNNLIPTNEVTASAQDYLFFDDGLYYRLLTLNDTEGYEPSNYYLFWVGTWATAVHEQPSTYVPTTGSTPVNITNANDLAWAISVVNGLNGVDPAVPSTNFIVTNDIDMSANIWVPIGTTVNPYTGTFDANGHVITGIHSPLNTDNMGMFGTITGTGTVENMALSVDFSGGNSVKMGSVAAEMVSGGTISNVETGGTIVGTTTTTTIGGIVADNNGTVQSSFAVNTITAATPTTHVGGLVGDNAGDLYNSYANATMSGSNFIGGLAGQNKGHIENCYSIVGEQTFPAFAYENAATGQIKICYADKDNGYVASPISGSTLDGYGLYGPVKERKAIGYMYDDNAIGTITGTNGYVHGATIDYTDNHLVNWNGLLWSLNQWVKTNPVGLNPAPTPWLRPTSANINGDLPILAFPADNCLATLDSDGKFLQYSSIGGGANGLDNLLTTFNDKMSDAPSSLFLYGNATEVTLVPESQVKVFINEDACLLQAAGSGNFGNTTVGITFDNSWGKAHAYPGGDDAPALTYDWHMMATSLRDAKIGATYTHAEGDTYTADAGDNVVWQESPADIGSLTDSYFPNGLVSQSTVTWDFYSFYEPEYHWVNLKRNKNNHFHQDSYEDIEQPGVLYQIDQVGDHFKHYHFDYPELDQSSTTTGDDACVFIPGKGYMMAISQDSYMSSTGTLNNGNANITVPLTMQSIQDNERGCNLLGNPYQAYLDMSAFCNQNTNLGNSYWVYIAEADNYVAGNCTASTNYALPSKTLHPHQAFFVKTNTDGVNAVFDYDMATASPVGYSYFRSSTTDYPLVNLFARNEQGNKDLAVIEMNRPVLDGSPKMRTLNNANFELYTRSNGQDYSILFTEEGTERVAVGFKAKDDGTYTLTWDTQNGQFKYLQLIDNITGAERDMLATDHYTFEAHATDLTTRFYVVFKVDNGEDDMGDTFAFFNGNEWVINGKGTLQLIDVTGRILYSKNLSGETYSRAHFDNFAAGVYMLRLVENNNNIKSQKIIIE